MATLAEGMTATLASLADWTGDRVTYQGRSFRTISGPMVLVDGSDLTGSLPGRVYQTTLLKLDFPTPPAEGAIIKVNGISYRVRGDIVEGNLHWVVTMAKHGA